MARVPKPKPCPFCRGTEIYMERDDMDAFSARCNDCYAQGPSLIQEWGDDEKDARLAIRAWNRRQRKAAVAKPITTD